MLRKTTRNTHRKSIAKTSNLSLCVVRFMGQQMVYKKMDNILNCQSEVRIFEEKNEKYHGFTLTKGMVLYIDISRFSEPEEVATNEVGMTLTGW